MATKLEVLEKIKAEAPGLRVRAVVVGVDRERTRPVYDQAGKVGKGAKGPDAVAAFTARTGVEVRAVAPVRAVIEHLFRQKIPLRVNEEFRPLSEKEKNNFEAYLATYHPDCTIEEIRANTPWDLKVAPDVHPTEPPTAEELRVLHEVLDPHRMIRIYEQRGYV